MCTIFVLGTNFKIADLDRVARVQWSTKEHIGPFLTEARTHFGLEEIFFLQTCNRREFYITGIAPTEFFVNAFLEAVSESVGCVLERKDFYVHQERAAAEHLFRVAASLDSMVLGESEIMKQIRDQSEAAGRHGLLGRKLRELVQTAIWAAKQVRSKTAITKNVVSIASLAFREVMNHTAGREHRRVVFVGAGHFIQSLLSTFAKADDLELIFVNRSLPTTLADAYDGQAMLLHDFLVEPPEFDAMITATGAPEAIFSAEWMAARAERNRILLLDAALPSDVDQHVRELAKVKYWNLDAMEDVLARNRSAREAEIPKTAPIFAEAWTRLQTRLLDGELSGYNRAIADHYMEMSDKALNHLLKQQLSNLSDDEEALLRGWTHALAKKLTKIPILGLKGVAEGCGEHAVHAYTRSVADRAGLFR
jgi:glutamyl-tRNA reductase